jgi:hypothetical protein
VRFIVEDLEATQEDLDFIGKHCWRSIDAAIFARRRDVAQLLLTRGANSGPTPGLFNNSLRRYAIHFCDKETALFLMQHGARMELDEARRYPGNLQALWWH